MSLAVPPLADVHAHHPRRAGLVTGEAAESSERSAKPTLDAPELGTTLRYASKAQAPEQACSPGGLLVPVIPVKVGSSVAGGDTSIYAPYITTTSTTSLCSGIQRSEPF